MTTAANLIDRDELVERCLNDADFTCQMLAVFIEAVPTTVQSLRAALEANLIHDAKRFAHTLKGSAGNLAIASLRQLATETEHLLASNELELAATRVGEIETILAAALQEAHQFRSELTSRQSSFQ